MKKLNKILSAKKAPIAAPTATDQFASLKKKFAELAKVRAQLAAVKVLYAKHDQLIAELIPLFITVEQDRFVVAREVTLGTEKHRLVPYFYDEKKGTLLAKQWKSTAFGTVTIE